MLTSMGAQFKKHINWDDLATSGWKHLFPMQSNLKKFKEIWRFILLIRSLFRRWAGRQNLNAVVWVSIEYSTSTDRSTLCVKKALFLVGCLFFFGIFCFLTGTTHNFLHKQRPVVFEQSNLVGCRIIFYCTIFWHLIGFSQLQTGEAGWWVYCWYKSNSRPRFCVCCCDYFH